MPQSDSEGSRVQIRYVQADWRVEAAKEIVGEKFDLRSEGASNDSWMCVRSQERGCYRFKESYVCRWAVRCRQ